MKYLLLEKDFEYRDSLDLITRYQVVEFLESQFAENVVKEIWRSLYATQDSIFSASTNHMLTWKYWNFIRDIEADQPFLQVKDVNKIEPHPMQFFVWRNSPKARVLIEFIVTVAFATAVHLMVANIMESQPTLTANITEYVEMQNALIAITDTTSSAYLNQ
jgi:hypothetical protein